MIGRGRECGRGGGKPDSGPAAVTCRVDDDVGIPPDRLKKVFEKPETDPDKKSGVELGLAAVKQFVGAHGGRVSVESEDGRGSTFRLTIP